MFNQSASPFCSYFLSLVRALLHPVGLIAPALLHNCLISSSQFLKASVTENTAGRLPLDEEERSYFG